MLQISLSQTRWVHIGSNYSVGEHYANLLGDTTQLAAVQSIQVGHRNDNRYLWLELAIGLVALVWLAIDLWRYSRRLPWRQVWHRLTEPLVTLPG